MHFDFGGAQVMVERVRRSNDGLLGLHQGIAIVPEVLEESRVVADDLGVTRLTPEQPLETFESFLGMAQSAEEVGNSGVSLPEGGVELERALETGFALRILARFQQLIAQGEPAQRQV